MVDVLRHELLEIEGVADALVKGEQVPESVRVVLSPDADVSVVELLVHDVLSAHGLLARAHDAETQLAVADRPVAAPDSVMLASLAVEEGLDGVSVTATTTDGRSDMRRARAGTAGVAEAVVAVVSHLARPDRPEPLLLVVNEDDMSGTSVVTVLLDTGKNDRIAGAALLDGGRAYGLARAVWQALSR